MLGWKLLEVTLQRRFGSDLALGVAVWTQVPCRMMTSTPRQALPSNHRLGSRECPLLQNPLKASCLAELERCPLVVVMLEVLASTSSVEAAKAVVAGEELMSFAAEARQGQAAFAEPAEHQFLHSRVRRPFLFPFCARETAHECLQTGVSAGV